MKFAIFFATVLDSDDGIFVDCTYFGGVAYDRNVADGISRDIVNDKMLPGTIISKVIPTENIFDSYRIAIRYFNNLAKDMYEVEDAKQRKHK